MSTPSSNSSLDVFAAIDQELGTHTDGYVDLQDVPKLPEGVESDVQKIIQGAAPNNIDTSKDKPAEGTTEDNYPDFFKPFQEILNQPYILPDDDKTDYGQRSVQEFGTGFAHINTRDAFFEETYQRNARQEFLDSNEHYRPLLDLEEGRIDKAQLLRTSIHNQLKSEADRNFEEFPDEKYQRILNNFFEDDGKGKPTAAGETRINEMVRNYFGHLNSIRQQADQHAKGELDTYRTKQAALTSQVGKTSIGGMQVDADLGAHLMNFIRSGKLDEWENAENLSPEEEASRALKKALIADDKAFTSFLAKVVKASVHHGVSTVARNKF